MIRSFTSKDIRKIQELALRCWMKTYGAYLDQAYIKESVKKYYSQENLEKDMNNEQVLFEIVEKEEIIGFCVSQVHGEQGEICRVYVDPESIGNGLGTELCKRAIAFLKEKGVKSVYCFTHTRNIKAHEFYKKLGFAQVENKGRVNDHPLDCEQYFEKLLN